MADTIKRVRIEAPWRGTDSTSAPFEVGRDRAAKLVNLLASHKGHVEQRGGSDFSLDTTFGPSPNTSHGLLGLWTQDKIAVTCRAPGWGSAARWAEPWTALVKPIPAANLATVNAGGATPRMNYLDFTAQTVTSYNSVSIPPLTRELLPGPRSTRFGKFAYGIAYDSPDDAGSIVASGAGFERLTRILRWDANLANYPVAYVNMPQGAQDILVHNGRLLVLGGRNPLTGLPNYPDHDALWFTRVLTDAERTGGINSGDVTTGWTDEVTGAVNRISLHTGEDDPGVAIAPVGRHLAVLKRRSVMLLTGFGPDSWSLRKVSSTIGCIDPRSVVSVDDGVFFLSKDGFMFFDGTNLVNVSGGLRRAIVNAAVSDIFGTIQTHAGHTRAEIRRDGYIELMIGYFDTSSHISFWGLLHIATGSWIEVTHNLSGIGYGMDVARTENFDLTFTDGSVASAALRTTPESMPETSRALDREGAGGAITRAFETKYHTRIERLTHPTNQARLRRIIIDYLWTPNGGTAGQFVGPTVTLLNSQGTVLDTYTLPSTADDANLQHARHIREVYAETDSIQVRIERAFDTSPEAEDNVIAYEVRDIWVEYIEAQEQVQT